MGRVVMPRWRRQGSLVIIGGTVAGQAIAFLASPVLSRIYSPTDYGLFATCSAMGLIIGAVAALRFELAIPLPARDADAISLVWLGTSFAVSTGLLGLLLVALMGAPIANALGQPALMPWLWLVPALTTAIACYMLLNQLAIRHRRFGAISRRNVLQQATTVLSQVILGAVSRTGGLVIGSALGQTTGAVSLLRGSRIFSREFKASRSRPAMMAMLRRYRRFPIFMGPAAVFNVLSIQLPVLLLGAWYGGVAAGWFGLAQRVLAMPMLLVGSAIGQVYLADLTRSLREGKDSEGLRLFLRASAILLLAGIVLFALLITLAPWAFATVFGQQWRDSGRYAQAMGMSLMAQLVAASLSQTLVALERQRLQLAWDVGRAIAIVLCAWVAHRIAAPAIAAVWTMSAVHFVAYGISWFLNLKAVRGAVPRAGAERLNGKLAPRGE